MYQNVSSAPAYSAEVLGCLIFFSKPGGKRNQLQKGKPEPKDQKIKQNLFLRHLEITQTVEK